MILRGHLVQLQETNGVFATAGFFAEPQGAADFIADYRLRAALTHEHCDIVARIIPGYRVDFDQISHLHVLQ